MSKVSFWLSCGAAILRTMVTVSGKDLFGKVDRVDGMFYVGTFFWHWCYVPLIPVGSYVVLQEGERKVTLAPYRVTQHMRAVRIPLCYVSVLLSWMRGICCAVGVIAIVPFLVAVTASNPRMSEMLPPLELSAVSIGTAILLTVLPIRRKASYKRACQLAKAIGLDDEGRKHIDRMYGQIAQRQAEKGAEKRTRFD